MGENYHDNNLVNCNQYGERLHPSRFTNMYKGTKILLKNII